MRLYGGRNRTMFPAGYICCSPFSPPVKQTGYSHISNSTKFFEPVSFLSYDSTSPSATCRRSTSTGNYVLHLHWVRVSDYSSQLSSRFGRAVSSDNAAHVRCFAILITRNMLKNCLRERVMQWLLMDSRVISTSSLSGLDRAICQSGSLLPFSTGTVCFQPRYASDTVFVHKLTMQSDISCISSQPKLWAPLPVNHKCTYRWTEYYARRVFTSYSYPKIHCRVLFYG